MSILREVIKSVGELEWNNLKEKLPILMNDVHLCRSEVFNMLDDVYLEFIQKPVKNTHYSTKFLELKEELDILTTNCEQGMKREGHNSQKYNYYRTSFEQLQNTKNEICFEVECCYHIHEMFVDLQLYKSECEKSLQILKKIKELMEKANSETVSKYFQKHFKLTESALHLRFSEVFMNKFIFEVRNEGSVSYIRVEKNMDIGYTINLFLQYYGYMKHLQELIEFLWEFIFVRIVTSVVKISSNDTEIKLKVLKRSEPYYEDVFKALHDVLKFLRNNFSIYIDSSKTLSLLEYIGNELKDRINSLLVSHCFRNIHKSVDGAKNLDYNYVIEQVAALQTDLDTAKLSTDNSLLKYAENLHQIHLSKAQEQYLEQIKQIMSKKNHDIIKVGTHISPKKLVGISSDLPSMSISSSVKDLHQLTEKLLLEGKKNNMLIDTVFNIFKFYRIYTTKNIDQMSSQDVALLYNNYTFIAHQLRQWNLSCSRIIFEDSMVPLFKEELIVFQVVSKETLDNYLTKEVNRLRNNLHGLTVADKGISPEFFETAVKKCLKQIELLKESWCDLVSQMVFNKSIGVCFNVLCDFLIKFILKFDIVEKTLKERCYSVFNTILKLCENYFVNEKDLKNFIKCWSQFQALSSVLKSDIVEVEINKYHECLKSNFEPSVVTKIMKVLFYQTQEEDDILRQLLN